MSCSHSYKLKPCSRLGTPVRFPFREVCGIAFLFWLAVFPYSANYLMFHPDERHYTDAGIIMHQTRDFLIPRDSDGSPRFLKPILTYWIVAGSFELFGISPMAARFPFLLLGGGCILLGSLIAHRIFRDPRVTLLAAAILSVNPLLFLAAQATLPDIVQSFFLLLSITGWIGLITERTCRLSAPLAWLGAGLAIATKGVPGVLLLGYSLAFLLLNPWIRLRRKTLFPMPWVVMGIGFAVFWYAFIAACHGEEAMRELFGDQVRDRLVRDWWRPLAQIPSTLTLYLILIGPSVFALFTRWDWRGLHNAWNLLPVTAQTCCLYILGWGALLLPCLAFVSPFTVRYFQLVVPLLCILFAWLILRGGALAYHTLCRWTSAVTLILLCFVFSIRLVMFELVRIPFQAAELLLFVLISGLFVARWIQRVDDLPHRSAAIAAHGILAFAIGIFCLLSPLSTPDQSQEMAVVLERTQIAPGHFDVWYIGKPALGAKLRMALGGQFLFHSAEAETLTHLPGPAPVIITQERHANIQLAPMEYLSIPISDGWQDLVSSRLVAAWWRGNLREFLNGRRERMVISVPRIALVQGAVKLPKEFSPSDKTDSFWTKESVAVED